MMRRRKNSSLFFLLLIFTAGLDAQIIVAPVAGTPQLNTRTNTVQWIPVKVNRKWGYADTSGKVMITPQYDAAEQFIGRYAVVQNGNKAYVIDTAGSILTPKGHDQIIQVEDSIFAVYKNSAEGGEGGWGAERLGGKEIVPTCFDRISRVNYFIFSCHRDTIAGYFHRNGTLIAPVKYDTAWVFNNRFLMVARRHLYGVFSFAGTVVLPDSCTQVRSVTSSVIAGEINNRWGAADESGKNVVPFQYDTLALAGSQFVRADFNDSVHVYCISKGRVPGTYTAATAFGSFWLKAYSAEKKCAIIDTSGDVIIPPVYDDVLFAGNGNWIVINNNKYGVCDKSGKVVVPLVYTMIQPYRNGMTVVYSGILQGLINAKGDVMVTPAQCTINIKGNIAKVMRPDAKAEFVKTDGNGNVISRDEYEEVRVIKIGGDNSYKQNTKIVAGVPNSKLVAAPKQDSLTWFFNARTKRFGLMDTYRGDTLSPAIYTYASALGNGYTLIGKPDTVESITLSGMGLETGMLYGIFDDSLGRFVIQPKYPVLTVFNSNTNRRNLVFRCVTREGAEGLIKADGTERILLASCIGRVSDGVAPFCVGGRWEFSESGANRTNWYWFALNYNVVNNGPFRNATESRNAGGKTISHTGGKWGFIDANGNVLIKPEYDSYQVPLHGTCIVRLDKKWGMLDTSGKILVPFSFDMVSYLNMGTELMVQTQLNSVQMGCIDTLGNIVVPIQYRKIIPLGDHFIGVSTNGKWGVSKTSGEVITDEKYLEVSPFSNGYAAVRTGRKWGIIDSTGKEIVAPVYDAAGTFSEGMCAVRQSIYWGFINTNGTLAVPCNYTMVGSYLRNAAPVKTKTGWALIDHDGKQITKPNFTFIERIGEIPVFSFRKDGVNGLLSTDGKVILPAKYSKLKDVGMNRIAFLDNLHWGIMDTSGHILANSNFDKIGVFTEGMCPVCVGSSWGYIGENGQYRIKPVFRSAAPFGDGLAYVVTLSQGGGFIDTLGNMKFSVEGNLGTTPFSENKTIIRWKTNYSVYTRYGHRLSRDCFGQVLPFCHGAAPVRMGMRWGLINFTGRYIVQPCYSRISDFSDGVAIVQTAATYGIYSLDGKQILAPEYDLIQPSGNLIRLQSDNKVGYLSRSGKVVWNLQE